MHVNETMVTLVGNVADAPELRYLPNGTAVAKLRVACTPRKRGEDGKFSDGESSWYTVTAWRSQAENAAESIGKGDRVIVYGALSVRQYEVEGQKRTSTEVDAHAIGVELTFATAKPVKAAKSGGNGGSRSGGDGGWGDAQPAQQARPAQSATPPSDGW